METERNEKLELTAEIVSAYVANNPVPAVELPALIESTHQSLLKLANGSASRHAAPQPAVPIKKSVTPDYLICLEDGKRYKTLKRMLSTRYGMTADQYREKWGLPADYPMVAPNYAVKRSEMAKQMGLGRNAASKSPARARRKADA